MRTCSPLKEFDQANKAARWNYQRDRVYAPSVRYPRNGLLDRKRQQLQEA